MKKITFLFGMLFLLAFQIYSQNPNKIKAEKYLSVKGELTFTFKVKNKAEIETFTKNLSIVNYNPKTNKVLAWANEKQFRDFESLNIPFEIPVSENEVDEAFIYDNKVTAKNTNKTNKFAANTLSFPVSTYPTYAQYAQQMQDFENSFPALVKKISLGNTTENDGKELLFVKISDNVNTDEQEPKLMLTSSMHGDEIAGYPMMLSLIDYILTVYADTGHSDHARIKNLVENSEIWINPSANPDGTYYGSPGNTSVTGSRRGNYNNIDLNRNYPDNVAGAHYDGNAYQTETLAFMALADAEHFVISANFHGGTELVNYPFDNAYVSQYTHPDGNWFEFTGVEYATHAQNDSNTLGDMTYMTADDDSNIYPSPGVTHGAEWYRVYGGRQDYMNYYKQCKEITIELSDTKILPASQLVNYWLFNKNSLLDFLTQGTYGFRGVVKDAVSGNPINATVKIVGHDNYGSHTFTDISHGDYYRPIKAGTYDIIYESDCYQSFTLTNQTIADYETKVLADVLLTPVASALPNGLSASSITTNSASISWNSASGNTFDLRYREIGSSTWIDVLGLSSSPHNLTGLTVSTNYEFQVRSVCASSTSAYSNSTNFATTAIVYCSSNSTNSSRGYIGNVSFGTINNTTSYGSGGYSDFTSSSTNVTIGSTYTISIGKIISGTRTTAINVWIDYNKDGDFSDLGEQIVTSAASLTTPITGNITIPLTASIGSTRMRVSLRNGGTPPSCSSFTYGEVEDYTINMVSNLSTWYADTDNDTFGNPNVSQEAVNQPIGYVANNSDCDDSNATINPNTVWYIGVDADSDGFFGSTTSVTQCLSPGAGYALAAQTTDDCDDSNATINP
ncbi:MAG: fibronectin type III domain-containing protein, partial [Flavobacteriaceae bacterium]|nr:fibronectin type III domain-containing protein [Flavobacteriaceae bacterium]